MLTAAWAGRVAPGVKRATVIAREPLGGGGRAEYRVAQLQRALLLQLLEGRTALTRVAFVHQQQRLLLLERRAELAQTVAALEVARREEDEYDG